MHILLQSVAAVALTGFIATAPAFAEPPSKDGAGVTVDTLGARTEHAVLTRGQVIFVNGQRFVVTQEPPPVAKLDEAPPEPRATSGHRPRAPQPGAIWVAPHWVYGPAGFSWVAGRYVAPRAGHVFVPPRWASLDGQYFLFRGFFVPYGVYVRSYFNRFYFSGLPAKQVRPDHGPYWPLYVPTRANSALTSANAHDPYWPIGARR